MTLPLRLAEDRAAEAIEPGMSLFVQAGPSEPQALRRALTRDPGRLAGSTICGAFVPGVNEFDYAALHPGARSLGFFVPNGLRKSFEAGHYAVMPLHYSAVARFLATRVFDLAILHVSAPDHRGRCSLGLNADLAPLVVPRAKRVLAFVNQAMPYTRGEASLRLDRLSAVVEIDEPLPTFPSPSSDDVTDRIGAHVAELVRDGDTIEIGLGKMPAAALRALENHRGLAVHSGMIIDEVAELAAAGALAAEPVDGRPPVVTGMAIGSGAIHAFARDERVAFRAVDHTHSHAVLAGIDRFVAINTAVEVDLFGQSNGETIAGRQVSGTGGFVDFARGAAASREGRSIVALPASAGGRSRIVPTITPGPVTAPRADADTVVTEHGAAQLANLTIDTRAEALIAIAAPEHRAALMDAWRDIRAKL